MGVSKVDYAGRTLIDLTADTITPEKMLTGTTAHNATGEKITGTLDDVTAEVQAQTPLVQYVLSTLQSKGYTV